MVPLNLLKHKYFQVANNNFKKLSNTKRFLFVFW